MPSTLKTSRSADNGLPKFPPIAVNNFIPISKYFRSADLLIRQANDYRAQHNELQLYTMLMRLASLVVETMPKHKDYQKMAPQSVKLRMQLLDYYVPELEALKLRLTLKNGADSSQWLQQPRSHDPNAVQISTSNLEQLDWGGLTSQPSLEPANSGSLRLPTAPTDLLSGDQQPGTRSARQAYSADVLPTFHSNVRPSSQATRDRHALLPATTPSTRQTQASFGGPLYPSFDNSPFAPIQYGSSSLQAPVEQQVGSLRIDGPGASLMDADALPRPGYGPTLGPQEMEVQQVAYPSGGLPPDAAGSCCEAPPPPPPPPPEEQPGAISQHREIREVQVSMGLMEEFLAYAKSNTRRGIESCGILSGVLDSKRGLFCITTLIIPKQEGTSDTVQALAEEEIFEAQDSRSLYPMGWIHTHPTQTCFLSSIDVHTQCGYQTMLDEAVAIVMAPSDRTRKVGIFRLSTPGGLKLVQKCQGRGFHTHPTPDTGQPIYEICAHVFMCESIKHTVVDLR